MIELSKSKCLFLNFTTLDRSIGQVTTTRLLHAMIAIHGSTAPVEEL